MNKYSFAIVTETNNTTVMNVQMLKIDKIDTKDWCHIMASEPPKMRDPNIHHFAKIDQRS